MEPIPPNPLNLPNYLDEHPLVQYGRNLIQEARNSPRPITALANLLSIREAIATSINMIDAAIIESSSGAVPPPPGIVNGNQRAADSPFLDGIIPHAPNPNALNHGNPPPYPNAPGH